MSNSNGCKRVLGFTLPYVVLALSFMLVSCGFFSPVPTSKPQQEPTAPNSSQPTLATLPTNNNGQATSAPSRLTATPQAGGASLPGAVSLGEGVLFGAEVGKANGPITGVHCRAIQQLGVKADTMWITWQDFEPSRGVFDWKKVDMNLNAVIRCGETDPGIHLRFISDWGNAPSAFNAKGTHLLSMPPLNDADAGQALAQLAAHLKGRVRYYSIENEPNGTGEWDPNPDRVSQYFHVLNFSYDQIKSADSAAVVSDGAIAAEVYVPLVAQDLLKGGQAQQAADFLNEYHAHWGTPLNLTASTVQAYLDQKVTPDETQWEEGIFSPSTKDDMLQLHYYGTWEALPTFVAWFKGKLQAAGRSNAFAFQELGYGWTGYGGWPGHNGYDPTPHAQDTVKLLTIAAGEGAQRVIYWRSIDIPCQDGPPCDSQTNSETPGLVLQNGPVLPAGVAFNVTVQKLGGSTSAQRLDLRNPSVWAYRFTRNGQETYVVWSTTPTTVTLPISEGSVTITDIQGATSTGNPQSVAIGVSPVFVQASQ